MPQSTVAKKSQILGAATALTAAGFLTIPAAAHAYPVLPLAPACTNYKFGGDFALKQSNGYRVEFTSSGPVASGRATATGGNGSQMVGTVSGGITGRHVDFTIRWDSGPRGHYTGDIDEFDFVHNGTSVDEANPGSTASWDSTVPFGCADPVAPPAQQAPAQQPPPQPAPPAAKTATVKGDVDVYDAPGGNGNVLGILRQGSSVQLVGDCPEGWCNVSGAAVPTGKGWVWGDLLNK